MLQATVRENALYFQGLGNGGTPTQNTVNQTQICFEFDETWNGLVKTLICRQGMVEQPVTLGEDNIVSIPWETLRTTESVKVHVIGTDGVERVHGTNSYNISVNGNPIPTFGVVPPTLPPWAEYLGKMETEYQKAKAEQEEATEQAGIATEKASKAVEAVEGIEQKVATATEQATNAKQSADNAKISEDNSKASEVVSSQALSDLLRMLGSDIATLTDGKLTLSQLPDLSINNSFLIADESELTSLTAQVGDMAYVEVGGEVTALYWLVGNDSTVLANWKQLGLSFVANAGHANTADNADNANRINNKRIVSMTKQQYEQAVKDTGVYYFVSGVQ